ncbi:alanine--tRNA ligase [Conexibacter woesei]|uniref:Alanine--tRNA ligase n=1 Tax=Conexibacter woesei (strain DSM 14684 / CCUG 47730 / CIP 108061 / JCM 11494 / NBRC 100937 / ID131577) TaxID=469383 RepID=D3FCU1_CONWI|nr:alanine--tRNA ligase [Conexibacter woesei]ADB51453.1 alanyl-tRNA synthetase [Conexibacter woesei DSM 14684]
MPMTSDEIRETFLSFFQQREHLRLQSAPLVPTAHDPSVLLTTAGMHPLKPYFQGVEQPPATRLTSCQKCFRATDIENVGNTLRHLTCFEMLGNFSIGDYFKEEVIAFAWELSTQGFGLDPERIWVTVFGGDEELGLGADEEAIELWQKVGVPRERIVECSREDNFWQAGPTGPCGPCSELYLDRGLDFGAPDDLPAGENERFLEFWNLVFMQYDQNPVNTLAPLPSKNIDTGLGLNRFAAMLQGKESVFETDQFWPLIELGQELSGRSYGQDEATTRALRILADHSRAMTFLVADGVVPSNEDRGYILRRVMRRAIQHGRRIGIEPGFLPKFAARVEQIMGAAYPEIVEHSDAIRKWLVAEEESFGRTLEQGTKLLDELIAQAKREGEEGLGAEDVFRLHDTYGFPIDITREIAAEHDLGVDEPGFEQLMDQQRARARAGAGGKGATGDGLRERAQELAGGAAFQSEFTGYATTAQETTVGALEAEDDGRVLVKLVESPFYAAGGGQVSDSGWVECADGDCRAEVLDVLRVAGGADQVVVVRPERGALKPGEHVHAVVDRQARHATEANHTATHLLHAALRRRLGGHVRQAGSAVQPDKLRFDFTHGQALSPDELRDVEDEVNEWVLANFPVRALTTTLDEAKRLGAMALFGEKYGDVVRMVEVGDGSFSRELCGGTHVRSTAEIGLFRVTAETSSAANVRRIEAITGPAAVRLLREHDGALRDAATALRATPEQVPAEVDKLRVRVKELEKAAKQGAGAGNGALDVDALVAGATEHGGGARVVAAAIELPDPKALPDVADRLKGKLGDAAIVLGTVSDGRVHLVASVAPALVERGVKAGAIVKVAAEVTGGGGGGRDTMARAGGRDPEKLSEAIDAARTAIEAALQG